MADAGQSVELLEKRLGADWEHLRNARQRSDEKRAALAEQLLHKVSDDVSVVVFGSLARREYTQGSDIDWTLLVDGGADVEHLSVARAVAKIVDESSAKGVGREGTFGGLTFSHELVHQIGGQSDSNQNTTRRILLLLESTPVGRGEAYDRVLSSVLSRYVSEDRGFLSGSAEHHIPRFLLNDFARYWWTMAVDFAYKQRARSGEGAAIRNLKLRMSRKLIYVSGLLTCFGCELNLGLGCPRGQEKAAASAAGCVGCLRGKVQRTPLETVATAFLSQPHLDGTARRLIGAYDGFLGMLECEETRGRLEKLEAGRFEDDKTFRDGRLLSHEFRDALVELFFDEESGLAGLTKRYGVF